jgi:hypothetical protein
MRKPAVFQNEKVLRCSFCGRSEVEKLVKAPEANICSDCVRSCMVLIDDPGDEEQEEAA